MDAVFKALADPTRRRLLDLLNARNGQTLHELHEGLDMSRQAAAKHLRVLEDAGLVATWRRGREKVHHLNAAPVNEIADRWLGTFRGRAQALADITRALEDSAVSDTRFVYVTYVTTTPEALWEALTEPVFIRRYFGGGGPSSDWQVGSKVLWQMDAEDPVHDWDQRVLECEPHRRLAYSWHSYQPEMAAMFGWSDERLAELRREPVSKVSFEIEQLGKACKLTVVHDDFVPDSEMLQGISEGWPGILSDLKSLLETGRTVSEAAAA